MSVFHKGEFYKLTWDVLGQLESIYRAATVVANICVYAATDKAKPVAIIVPAEPALKQIAEKNGIEGNGLEDLVHSKKLNGIVLKDLQVAGRQGGLGGIEIIEGVVLAEEEWNAVNVRLPGFLLQGMNGY